MLRFSSKKFCPSENPFSSNVPPNAKPFDNRALTYLRTFFGTYSSKPCVFVGSPAFPFGPSNDVRYESLDVFPASLVQQQQQTTTTTTNNKRDSSTSFASSEKTKSQLHRIHHVAGFISSIYVAEYRTYYNGADKMQKQRDFDRSLVLLDTGIPSDVTRLEVALRHVLCASKDSKKDFEDAKTKPDFVSSKMKLVFATHAHADHWGGARVWYRRGCPVVTVPNVEQHWMGIMGKVQLLIEIFGANFYSWYLQRQFPEFTWINPFWKLPQLSQKEHRVGSEMSKLIPNNRITGGSPLPIFNDWIVLQVPGHTHHMAVLYHPQAKMFYAADMFMHQFGKFRAPIPVDRLDCYLKSLDMIKELPVRWILMAHGGIMKIRLEGEPKNENIKGADAMDKIERTKSGKVKHSANNIMALAEETEKDMTFREICESVAARAIASEKQESKTSPVVAFFKKFTTASVAPKYFKWERDMVLPEDQINKMKTFVATHQDGQEGNFENMKHIRNYKRDTKPFD